MCSPTGFFKAFLLEKKRVNIDLPTFDFARINCIGYNGSVIFWSYKSWITIFFEQQHINVAGSNFESISTWRFHGQFSCLQSSTINIDFRLCPRRKKFTRNETKSPLPTTFSDYRYVAVQFSSPTIESSDPDVCLKWSQNNKFVRMEIDIENVSEEQIDLAWDENWGNS